MGSESVTKIINVERHCWGTTSGEQGIACYDDHLYGLPLEELTGPLGHGAQVEVTVRVLKRGRKVSNPWLKKRRRNANG